MVREIPPNQKQIESSGAREWICGTFIPLVLYFTGAVLINTVPAEAESLAARNREGNRYFNEGRYEEAEKAYLKAQVKNPGRPEIMYNLGNALIKQEKYPQGIQALQESAAKGENRLKTDSLYNSGNAMYSMGNYKEAAQAFIEALKLDPDDKDAKHNLELALQKLKQQQQNQPASNKDQKDPDRKEENQSRQKEENRSQPNERKQEQADSQNDRKDPAKMQPEPPVPREGSITREQAEQILDAVRNQELEQQRKKIEAQPRQNINRRDW